MHGFYNLFLVIPDSKTNGLVLSFTILDPIYADIHQITKMKDSQKAKSSI